MDTTTQPANSANPTSSEGRTIGGYRVTLEGKIIAQTFDWERGTEEWPVTNMFDDEGEPTEILEEVVAIVFTTGPEQWYTLNIRDCEPATSH